jgi:TonB family protein
MRCRFVVLVVALLAVAMSAAAQDSAPPQRARTVLHRVVPTYPDLARNLHISGVVKLRATVATSGNVKSIEALGGNPLLIKAAEEAVGTWKFASAAEETHELIELRFGPR